MRSSCSCDVTRPTLPDLLLLSFGFLLYLLLLLLLLFLLLLLDLQ